MKLEAIQRISTDVLVIGGGAAGLRAAIEARKFSLKVALTSESRVGFQNNTAISKATFAAAGIWKEPGDSPETHFKDSLAAGRFINDRRLVATMTHTVRQQVSHLKKFGVNFRQHDGELLIGQAPGHTYPRHVSAEATKGINITRPMRQHAASLGIQFIEGVLVTRLLRAGDRVAGVLGIDDKGQVLVITAKSTILATGGAGRIYRRTNNAIGSTGDGYVLAYDIGAVLRDMEFVQFYPTGWGKQGSKLCLYEWLIPIGATIRNSLGVDILKRYGMNDFASVTRDILTRTVMREILDGRGIEGNVILDFTTVPEGKTKVLQRGGLVNKEGKPEQIAVAPTTHFFMGGIRINESSETGIDGLYAAGEVCGGLHGANRLGGNAISETLTFGTIAGNQVASSATKMENIPVPHSEIKAEVERLKELASGTRRENLDELQQVLTQTMWDKVGVIKDRQNLEDARKEILVIREQLAAVSLTDHHQLPQAIKLANMLTVSEMVCRAALMRTESRGAHYRTDYSEEDNQRWLKTIEISCQNRKMVLKAASVPEEINQKSFAPHTDRSILREV